MIARLSVALLLAATPALAQDAPPPAEAPEAAADAEGVTDPKPLPYKLKKVCRPQEVVGSSIPRMVCSSKRVYLKPGEAGDSDQDGQAPRS